MGTRRAASLCFSRSAGRRLPSPAEKWAAAVQQQPTQEIWMESKY